MNQAVFVGHAQHAVELVGRHAFLARCHEVKGQKPLVQGNVRPLENRADRDRELTLAGIAVVKPGTMRLARNRACPFGFTTMGAESAFGPTQGFKVFPGCVLVVKNRIKKVGHGRVPKLLKLI